MTPHSVPPARVESPCVKVCVLDVRNVCVGCGRTLDEIANWSRLSVAEQRLVCERAAVRRQAQSDAKQL